MNNSPLLPGVKRGEVFAWAMFDFANSGYTTVVLIAVFATYFVGIVANNAAWATLLWVSSLSLSYLLSMLLMPAVCAWCDRYALKKRALLPTLESLAQFCIGNGYFLNVEIKPTPGTEAVTGTAVAQEAMRLCRKDSVPPLLTSFKTEALAAAQHVAAFLPRGLLLDSL